MVNFAIIVTSSIVGIAVYEITFNTLYNIFVVKHNE